MTMVLAHMGGIPEALGVALPLVVLFVIVRLGSRRAQAAESERRADAEPPEGEV